MCIYVGMSVYRKKTRKLEMGQEKEEGSFNGGARETDTVLK